LKGFRSFHLKKVPGALPGKKVELILGISYFEFIPRTSLNTLHEWIGLGMLKLNRDDSWRGSIIDCQIHKKKGESVVSDSTVISWGIRSMWGSWKPSAN